MLQQRLEINSRSSLFSINWEAMHYAGVIPRLSLHKEESLVSFMHVHGLKGRHDQTTYAGVD